MGSKSMPTKVKKDQLTKDLDRPNGIPPPEYGILPPDWEATSPEIKVVDGRAKAPDPFAHIVSDGFVADGGGGDGGGSGSARLAKQGPWTNVGRSSIGSIDHDDDADGGHDPSGGSDEFDGVGSQAVRAAASLQSSITAGKRLSIDAGRRKLPHPPTTKPPRLSKENIRFSKEYAPPLKDDAEANGDDGVHKVSKTNPKSNGKPGNKKAAARKVEGEEEDDEQSQEPVKKKNSRPEIMTVHSSDNNNNNNNSNDQKGEKIPSLLSSHLLDADADKVTATTPDIAPTPSPPPQFPQLPARVATPPRSTITPRIVTPTSAPAPPRPSAIIKSTPARRGSPLLTKSGKAPRKATPPRSSLTPKVSAPTSNLNEVETVDLATIPTTTTPAPAPPTSVPSLSIPNRLIKTPAAEQPTPPPASASASASASRPTSVDSFLRNEEMMEDEANAESVGGGDGGSRASSPMVNVADVEV